MLDSKPYMAEAYGGMLDKPFELEARVSSTSSGLYSNIKRNLRALTTAGYLGLSTLIIAGCADGCDKNNPTAPTNPGVVTLQVYNATTGQRKDMTFEVPGGSSSVSVNAADLASGLDNVVTSEFAVRGIGVGNSLGPLITAAGPQANIPAGNYEVFVPANDDYSCVPNISMLRGKRDFVVGFRSEPGATGPIELWTDAIGELRDKAKMGNGRRLLSILYDPSNPIPDLTVGFGISETRGSAWRIGTNLYFVAREHSFKVDYNRPGVKDTAVVELWEKIFGVDDLCDDTTRLIGLSRITSDKQWGLSPQGINITLRNITRADP